MFGFGKKAVNLSTPDKARIFEKAAANAKGTSETPSLRALLADALGNGTSPDGQGVTGLLKDFLDYADFKPNKPTDASAWWESADHEQRLAALSSAAAGMK